MIIDEREEAHLKSWIGRTERAEDLIAPELVRRFRAVFDEPSGEPQTGEAAPLGIHWCLSPGVAPMSALGHDGHPARGGFLPPVPLPRRMWAGGQLAFKDGFRVGDRVERLSRIVDVAAKDGRSGPLCFVTVEHEYVTDRGPVLTERHDIVYRDAANGQGSSPAPASDPGLEPLWREPFPTSATLLFRYSAITFNGHRIHYDLPYAQTEEGYANLVVHGPLQANALLRLAATILGKPPARFSFRGLSPLTIGQVARLNAEETEGGLNLWVDHEGRRTMAAQASEKA